jgi:hypothetical protein
MLRHGFVLLALTTAWHACASSTTITYKAACTGSSTVPPVSSKATGSVSIRLINQSYATGYFYATNIKQMTMAHLHAGAVGSNGSVVAWAFNATYGPISGSIKASFTFNPSLNNVSALLPAGQIYFNIHTSAYSAGELRGQLRSTVVLGDNSPSGSYRDSCKGCTTSNSILSCSTCKDGDGLSSLDTSLCIQPADVSNQHGMLTCTYPQVPSGSYLDTCNDCTMSNSTLSCSCKDGNGLSSLDTSLCIQPADVSNQHGILNCIYSRMPSGSYMDTCIDCTMSYSSLSCSCGTGFTTFTTLDTSLCISPPVVNSDNWNAELACVYQQMPAGTYTDTCTNCTMSGSNILYCYCRGSAAYLPTALCTRPLWVENKNTGLNSGLVCGPQPLPAGSYRTDNSCKDCTMSNNTLSCSCKNGDGKYLSTSLDTSLCRQPPDVSNTFGVLTCLSRTLPPGSYTDTCNDCTMSNSTLSCSCKNEDGKYSSTSLDTSLCIQPADVSNQHGVLTCISPRMPAGSYIDTCRGCTMSNSTLSCSCNDEDGNYLSTSLDTSLCIQPADVSNKFAMLTCVYPRS